MPKSRLVFINRFFSPDHSATAQILSDLTQHLSAQGYEVHVITSRGLYADPSVVLPRRQELDGAMVTRVWTSRFGRSNLLGRAFDYLSFYPTMAVALWRIARRGDIVVAKTDPPLLSVVAAPIVAARGAKLINWLQDLYPEVAIELGMKVLAGPLGGAARSLRNASLRAAAANVAIGQRMATRIEGQGVARKRITIISNWSDDQAVTPQSTDSGGLRAAWGFQRDDFVVGYSGNLGRAHDVDTILGAADRLRAHPHIKFLFVGGGRQSERLGAAIEAAGLTSFVFQPYQPRDRLAQSLAVADVHWLSLQPRMEGLIVPSKFYGVSAAGRGSIIIASLQGDLGATVLRYGGGVVIEPGDIDALTGALLTLSLDRGPCIEMGAQARRVLDAHFSKAASLDRWSRLICEVDAELS